MANQPNRRDAVNKLEKLIQSQDPRASGASSSATLNAIEAILGLPLSTSATTMLPEDAALWPVAEAKARLSELIDKAGSGAQTITRNGKPVAVVVGIDDWKRRTERKGNLFEFLQSAPLGDAELDIGRWPEEPRDLGL